MSEELIEAFTFICEDTVVWAAVLTKQGYIGIVCTSLIFYLRTVFNAHFEVNFNDLSSLIRF